MKVWENKIVPVAFAISSLLFLFAALKPVIKGQQLNVVFLCVGALSFILAIATWRKSRGGTVPPNDA